MGEPVLLTCDWGNTNLRAWTLDADGGIVARRDFALGVLQLNAGEAQARFEAEVRPALAAQDLPAILCGAVGSNVGWTTVAYADCPASLGDLARGMVGVTDRARIVPGVRCDVCETPDVMRGEETQVFGWLSLNPGFLQGCHLVCHPGTHPKWVLVEDGRISRFVSAMTGELFALLCQHSILKSDAAADDDAAFDAGLAAAGDGSALAARLFTARSRVAAGCATLASTPSYLSGLLIGAEAASILPLFGGAPERVILLGDAALCGRYARALDQLGLACETYDGEAAAVAGLWALHRTGDRA